MVFLGDGSWDVAPGWDEAEPLALKSGRPLAKNETLARKSGGTMSSSQRWAVSSSQRWAVTGGHKLRGVVGDHLARLIGEMVVGQAFAEERQTILLARHFLCHRGK